MSEKIEDGGAAFPLINTTIANGADLPVPISKSFGGLTKRELFAGMALMGLLNNAESRIFPMKHQNDKSNAEILAENAFYMADAMLKEGRKENDK